MPGLVSELQGSPKWMQDYIENLVKQSRQLGAEKYQPYGQATPEQSRAIRAEIEKLQATQNKSKFDIIPFSITGRSKPIEVSPFDLKSIIDNESFAQKIYESAVGHPISKEELADLRSRAQQTFQSAISTSPEVRQILETGMKEKEEALGRINQARQPFQADIQKLSQEGSQIGARLQEIDTVKADIQQQIAPLQLNMNQLQQEIEPLTIELETATVGERSYLNLPSRDTSQSQAMYAYQARKKKAEESLKQLNARKAQIQTDIDKIVKKPEITKLDQERDKIGKRLREIESAKSGAQTKLEQIQSELPKFEINPENSLKRASIEREVNKLQRSRGRIAPMNETHERAINMLERSFNDDTMKLASDELREANRHSGLRAIEPLVRSSLEGPSDEYMNKYVNDYTRDMRKALEDESEEQYLEEIAPKINMSFAQMGAFHSGARAKALRDSLSQHRLKLQREISHLTGSARDKAMEHHELQKRREQSGANLLEQATKSENEGHRHQSEMLRQQAVTKHGMANLNVAALGQVARAKQEQEQHEIDVARQEHERQLLYPQEQLAREAAIVSGLPPQPIQSLSSTMAPGPNPPNLYTLGAGALSTLASGFGQKQQQQPFKKGGSVRKIFANGGPVGSDEIGNEIRKIIQEQGHGDKSRMEQVSHYNPLQSWLKHVGNEMLANPGEDTLLSLGRGSAAAMEHADVVKERAANLHDKIQNTKLSQYKVLAEYENMKEHSALQRAQLGETSRYHNIMNNMAHSRLNQKQMAKPISASERKAEIDAKKDLMRAIRMKKEVNHIGDLIKKTSTGPVAGRLKLLRPKTKVDNQIEVGTNKLILDMHQGMKNIPRSEEFMKRVESTKPNIINHPEANEDSLNLMRQGANDVEEHSISTLLSMGWTPEKIEKQFKVKVPEHMLGESVHEMPEEEAQQEQQSYGNIIQMIDPGGNPLEVPADQVEEALNRGAIIAQ